MSLDDLKPIDTFLVRGVAASDVSREILKNMTGFLLLRGPTPYDGEAYFLACGGYEVSVRTNYIKGEDDIRYDMFAPDDVFIEVNAGARNAEAAQVLEAMGALMLRRSVRRNGQLLPA